MIYRQNRGFPRKTTMTLYHTTNTRANNKQRRFATIDDCDCLSFSILKNRWAGMSNKANILLSYFVAIASIGHPGLSIPIPFLLESINKRLGYTCSRSTLFRALCELRDHGFIRSHKYRVGDDRFATKIEFLEAMRFVKNSITPKDREVCDSSPQVSNWDEVACGSTNTRVNSPNLSYINKKPRGRASESNLASINMVPKNLSQQSAKSTPPAKCHTSKNNPPARKKIHPAMYCAKVNTTGPDTRFILARAAFELEIGGDFPGHSGVPWDSYRWDDMTICEKDSLYRREILPLLRSRVNLSPALDLETLATLPIASVKLPQPKHNRSGGEIPPGEIPPGEISPGKIPPEKEWTPEEIRTEIRKIRKIASKHSEKEDISSHKPIELSLSDKEMKILEAAKRKAAAM